MEAIRAALRSCCLLVLLLTCSSDSTPRGDHSPSSLYRYQPTHAFADISVPFFLYSGGDFDVFWNSCQKKIFAKGVEVSFLLHLQDHPWRTRDPEEAAVFVIPGLFSVALNSHHNESNCDLSIEEMSTTLASAVQKSHWFNRYQGRDHLMVMGYFKAEYFVRQSVEWSGLLKQATLALHSGVRTYVGKLFPRCIISVGHHASPNENSNVEVKTRKDLIHMRPLDQDLLDLQAENSMKPQRRSIFMLGQANKVKYYRNRVTAIRQLGDVGVNSFIAASVCEKGMKFKSCGINKKHGASDGTPIEDDTAITPVTNCCLKHKLSYSSFLKQMMMSNFSLLIGGGDPGSSRLADALALNVPQLILSDGFYERYAPFPCIVPWRQITEQISEKLFNQHPKQTVDDALKRATERRESMIRLQQQYASDVDWTHPQTLAPNNLLVETVRKCFAGIGLERKSAVIDRVMKRTKEVKCFPT